MKYLSEELQKQLKGESGKAEKTGRLTENQLDSIYTHKLFNLFVPEYLGGLELDLLSGLKVQEALAKIDGSLGWTITLCSGANAFAGYLPTEISDFIFKDPQVCLGGSGKIGGIAKENKEGYIINGKWSYVTGTPHITIFTANCQIEREGELLSNPDGSPYYKSFFFKPDEVTVIEDWKTIGLVATASHSYRVDNVKVPVERSFQIEASTRTIDHLIYQYPFLSFAEVTLAVNHIGMQEHFIEQVQNIFDSIREKAHKGFREQLYNKMKREIRKRKEEFYFLIEVSWEELKQNGEVSGETQDKISTLCKDIVKKGRENILEVYPYLGIPASDPSREVNRIIRDVLTAGQHSLLL